MDKAYQSITSQLNWTLRSSHRSLWRCRSQDHPLIFSSFSYHKYYWSARESSSSLITTAHGLIRNQNRDFRNKLDRCQTSSGVQSCSSLQIQKKVRKERRHLQRRGWEHVDTLLFPEQVGTRSRLLRLWVLLYKAEGCRCRWNEIWLRVNFPWSEWNRANELINCLN